MFTACIVLLASRRLWSLSAKKVEVTLSPAIAVVTVKEPLKIEDVNAALAKAGDYSATSLN